MVSTMNPYLTASEITALASVHWRVLLSVVAARCGRYGILRTIATLAANTQTS